MKIASKICLKTLSEALLAPPPGVEPGTIRLTGGCSAIELQRHKISEKFHFIWLSVFNPAEDNISFSSECQAHDLSE
jgi:hypothetical protein